MISREDVIAAQKRAAAGRLRRRREEHGEELHKALRALVDHVEKELHGYHTEGTENLCQRAQEVLAQIEGA